MRRKFNTVPLKHIFFISFFLTSCGTEIKPSGVSTPLPVQIFESPTPEPPAPNPTAPDNYPKPNPETEINLDAYFGEYSGTAVFLDSQGNYTVYNKAASETRVSPRSTFKIISTLAAFEYGVVTPEQSVIGWDGTQWTIDSWNADLSIREAFQSSCVWYYRKLIDIIGKENVAGFLVKIQYGNCDISRWEGDGINNNPKVDGFWLESSLAVSPREQVDILHKIFEEEVGINQSYIGLTKKPTKPKRKGHFPPK